MSASTQGTMPVVCSASSSLSLGPFIWSFEQCLTERAAIHVRWSSVAFPHNPLAWADSSLEHDTTVCKPSKTVYTFQRYKARQGASIRHTLKHLV